MEKSTITKVFLAILFVVFYFYYLSLVVKPQIESRFFAKESNQERQTVTNPNYDLKKIYENPQSEEIFPKATTFPSITLTISPTTSLTPMPTVTPSATPTDSANPSNTPSVTPTATVAVTDTPTFTPTPTVENSSTPTPTPTATACDSVSFSQETSGSGETIISVSGAWWLVVRANPNYSSVEFDEGNHVIKLHFTNDSGVVNIHTGWEGGPICKTYNWTK